MEQTEPNFSDNFSAIELPALPETLIRLLEVCNDPEADIVVVGKTAARDIFIAAKILNLANSAFLGTKSTFVNIEQAVIYLGIDTVRNLAISVSIHEAFREESYFRMMNIGEFWHHSLLTALLAKEFSERIKGVEPAEAYLAGLLHDIGKCLLNGSNPDQYAEILKSQGDSAHYCQLEKEHFGGSHADAGAWLAKHWQLDAPFATAIRLHHSPLSCQIDASPLEKILYLANLLATNPDAKGQHVEEVAAHLQLELAALRDIIDDQRELVLEIARVLGITVTVPAVPAQNTPTEETGAPGTKLLIKKVTSIAKVSGILDNLIKAKTPNRVFLVLEESCRILFDSTKCAVFIPDEGGSSLSIHGSFRNPVSRKLRSRKFLLAESTLLRQWLSSRKIILIDQEDQLQEPIVGILLEAFGETSLLSLSFSISDNKRGTLLLAKSREIATKIEEQEESLLLLTSHVGNRLHLEDLKKQHAEALAKERISTMEDVARSLAHEISNPLSIIQNYISLLAKRDDFVTNMPEELHIIGKEIERIGHISKQLNDLSTLPLTRAEERIEICTVIEDTLRFFRHSALDEKKISIIFDPDPALPAIWTKKDALRQILNNLISNSLEALDFGGKIEISCSAVSSNISPGDEIIITVADNGSGVSPTIAAKLFKAGQTTKGKGHAGLGLAIVKKLASDLKGQIYHSTTKEGLTEFKLHLPVKTQSST